MPYSLLFYYKNDNESVPWCYALHVLLMILTKQMIYLNNVNHIVLIMKRQSATKFELIFYAMFQRVNMHLLIMLLLFFFFNVNPLERTSKRVILIRRPTVFSKQKDKTTDCQP
jgi:hypothetical protein